MRVVGLDLAGSEKRNTGYCCLEKGKANIRILHSDHEIIEQVKSDKPEMIGIDAPLSLPKGRRSIEQRNNIHFRECDLELRALGIRFFPITLGPMRMLTKRGMGLKRSIEAIGIDVIEVYPGATYDLFNISRKDRQEITVFFNRLGFNLPTNPLSQDELDAVCCAFTAGLFRRKRAEAIGDPDEGTIIIPKVKKG